MADPQYISHECLTNMAATIKFLTKNKIVLCTDATVGEKVESLLDLKKTAFIPKHVDYMIDEFGCFTNFEISEFL